MDGAEDDESFLKYFKEIDDCLKSIEDVDVTGAVPNSSIPQVPSDLLYFPSSSYTGGIDGTAASGSNDCYFKLDRNGSVPETVTGDEILNTCGGEALTNLEDLIQAQIDEVLTQVNKVGENDDNQRGSVFGNFGEGIPGEDDVDSIMRSLESWAPSVQTPLNLTTHEDLGCLKSSGVVEEHRDASLTSESNTILPERDLSQRTANQARGTMTQRTPEELSKVKDHSTGMFEDSKGDDHQRSSVGTSRTSRDQLPLSVATLSRLFQCNSGYASSWNVRDRESHLPKSMSGDPFLVRLKQGTSPDGDPQGSTELRRMNGREISSKRSSSNTRSFIASFENLISETEQSQRIGTPPISRKAYEWQIQETKPLFRTPIGPGTRSAPRRQDIGIRSRSLYRRSSDGNIDSWN